MPNWVYNTLSVTGETEADIQEFAERMARPIPDFFNGKYPEFDMVKPEFSFWNVVSPDPEIWEAYATAPDATDGWYEWNCRNWGTKWDANDVYVDTGETSYTVSFQTAWSPVLDLVLKMSQQYRHLNFEYNYEEEQGWGGAASFDNGVVVETSEYDIPSSHKEYEERGNEGNCACQWSSDPEEWYEDCPKEGDRP